MLPRAFPDARYPEPFLTLPQQGKGHQDLEVLLGKKTERGQSSAVGLRADRLGGADPAARGHVALGCACTAGWERRCGDLQVGMEAGVR